MARPGDIAIREGLRAVALFEAFKGLLALAAAGGLFYVIPHDARHLIVELVGRLHLNAGRSYPNVFYRVIEDTSNAQLWLIAALVVAYAAVRFTEAYGLWYARAWGEWVAAVSGGIYIPLELYELSRGVSSLKLGALAINVAIVAFMVVALHRKKNHV
jgi:uncharacterized membrane protein (DUF2068 family)